jgi:uncharacterized protein (DUF1810 family)
LLLDVKKHVAFFSRKPRGRKLRVVFGGEPGMIKGNDASDRDDSFELSRFISAQERIYDIVLDELRSGRKRTHWMWYIFPQIDGLGHSSTTKHYAIKSMEEARQYLAHPVLGTRLVECAEAVLAVEGRSISDIFGYPDDLKLKSSMTLFASIAEPNSVFERILDKYFQGERDVRTLRLLEILK